MNRPVNKSFKIAFCLSFGILLSTGIKAQENSDWIKSDISTYRQYVNMQWDSLIAEGNQYIEKGVDYYYLRIRLGIACYVKQNYVGAIGHLNKALELNPGDQLTIEYLYYSNLYRGNDFEAKIWGNRLASPRKEELGIKKTIYRRLCSRCYLQFFA